MDNKLFSFNVDTKMNVEIDLGQKFGTIASLTGIDCEMKAAFKYSRYNTGSIYTLNMDNSVTKVNEKQYDYVTRIFPSVINPKNITGAMFKYECNIIKDRNRINTDDLIRFGCYYSVIRIYQDIFLVYDENTKSWVILRIVTP